LLALFQWTAEIILTMNDQCWGFCSSDIFHWRIFPKDFNIFIWCLVANDLLETPVIITGTPHTDKIADTALSHTCFEALGVPNDPQSHISAITSTSDPHFFWIDIGKFFNIVSPAHQIFIVFCSPFSTMDGFGVFFPISSTTSGIGKIDNIPF